MFSSCLTPLVRTRLILRTPRASQGRPFSRCTPLLSQSTIPVQVTGTGTGTVQSVAVKDKPYTFQADTYTALGGTDASPSPVAYALASLSSCNQVTGFVVARDHGIRLGKWKIKVDGVLPTAVLVGGAKEGNPNWESVRLEVRVQTDLNAKGEEEEGRFRYFVDEVERRCPITQLFKLSGVRFESVWVNEVL
ncbi:OsmC family protein [Podospora didyma]|uniref:OsmC family protein n=1 Tax=Podospora didyma TaxID=330526 RepID=A0AAE0NBU0_9PEZI|nr:OsmC family protein [Podospora didyma]